MRRSIRTWSACVGATAKTAKSCALRGSAGYAPSCFLAFVARFGPPLRPTRKINPLSSSSGPFSCSDSHASTRASLFSLDLPGAPRLRQLTTLIGVESNSQLVLARLQSVFLPGRRIVVLRGEWRRKATRDATKPRAPSPEQSPLSGTELSTREVYMQVCVSNQSAQQRGRESCEKGSNA